MKAQNDKKQNELLNQNTKSVNENQESILTKEKNNELEKNFTKINKENKENNIIKHKYEELIKDNQI